MHDPKRMGEVCRMHEHGDIILTESSYRRLREELEHLKTVKRAEIAEALRKARAYGDLSENFEYHSARREQGILNGRIAEMEKTLEIAKVVPDSSAPEDAVGLGSIVMVRDLETGEEWEYTLVDAVQADPINDRISIQSPVGQALMHKKVGDVVEVQVPAGKAHYEVLRIRHE
jgi:transcription elongation factor GreA